MMIMKEGAGKRFLALLTALMVSVTMLPISGMARAEEAVKDSSAGTSIKDSGELVPPEEVPEELPIRSLFFQGDDLSNGVSLTKSASVLNANGRKYELTLTAKSNETITEDGEISVVPADVALVLDVTRSMDLYPVQLDANSIYVPFGGWNNGAEFSGSGWLENGDKVLYKDADASGYFRQRQDGSVGNEYPWRAVSAQSAYQSGIKQTAYRQTATEFVKTERTAWKTGIWFWTNYGWNEWSNGVPTHIKVKKDKQADYSEGQVGISRMDVLKSTAYEFIQGFTWYLDKGSQMSVHTFGGSNNTIERSLTSDAEDLLQSMTDIRTNGHQNDTQLYIGLQKAINEMDRSSSENRVIIAFTDGEEKNSASKNKAKELAEQAKADGIKIFTVSLLSRNDSSIQAFLKEVSSTKYDQEDKTVYHYSCTDLEGLQAALKKISEIVGEATITPVPIENATIVDVLDARFELLPTEVERLKGIYGEQVQIQSEEGVTTVEWLQQTIPADGYWKETLQIRAKEDFFGGNDVPTNQSPQSGVQYTNGKGNEVDVPFELPYVNVPIQLEVDNAETTIFLGESVPIELTDSGTAKAVADWMDKTKYNWYGEEPTGTIAYRWQNSDGQEIPVLGDLIPYGAENKYTLQVTYAPSTDGSSSVGEAITETSKNGIYTVTVKRGEIKISKELPRTEIWYPNGDPIFTFRLERLASSTDDTVLETTYHTIRYVQSQAGLVIDTVFDDLPKGVYRVTEQSSLRHQVKQVKGGSGDRSSVVAGADSSLHYIGQVSAANAETDLNKDSGKVIFVNEAKQLEFAYFSHTDVKSNSIRIVFSDENRTIRPDGSDYVTQNRLRLTTPPVPELAAEESKAKQSVVQPEPEAVAEEKPVATEEPVVVSKPKPVPKPAPVPTPVPPQQMDPENPDLPKAGEGQEPLVPISEDGAAEVPVVAPNSSDPEELGVPPEEEAVPQGQSPDANRPEDALPASDDELKEE